jgi:hypothetical protein
MPKGLLAFIVVAGIVFASIVIIFMKKSADKASERPDKVLEEFKTINEDLQKTTIAIDSANKMLPDSLSDKKY